MFLCSLQLVSLPFRSRKNVTSSVPRPKSKTRESLLHASTGVLLRHAIFSCTHFQSLCCFYHSCVYGGVPKSRQLRDLRSGVEIVIATPGRLIDHLEQGNTNLKRVTVRLMTDCDRSTLALVAFSTVPSDFCFSILFCFTL